MIVGKIIFSEIVITDTDCESHITIIIISEIAAENSYITRISLHHINTHYDNFRNSNKAEMEGKSCNLSMDLATGRDERSKCPFRNTPH